MKEVAEILVGDWVRVDGGWYTVTQVTCHDPDSGSWLFATLTRTVAGRRYFRTLYSTDSFELIGTAEKAELP